MKFRVQYNPSFFNDLSQAVDWYNEKQVGLGERFLINTKKQTAKLSISALQFAVKYDEIRCMRIEKFPYLVHYRVNEMTRTVRVEALFHSSRNPKAWNDSMPI